MHFEYHNYMKIIELIRKRSRRQWQEIAIMYFEQIRAWTHTNGEYAAAAGLLIGMLIVLAFRLFLFLMILLALCAFAIWCISLPESDGK